MSIENSIVVKLYLNLFIVLPSKIRDYLWYRRVLKNLNSILKKDNNNMDAHWAKFCLLRGKYKMSIDSEDYQLILKAVKDELYVIPAFLNLCDYDTEV